MGTLNDIAIGTGTDKSSEIHNYCEKYERTLRMERPGKYKILEIGVLLGQSLQMWAEYFFNSTIVGIDINEKCAEFESGNIEVEIGSQVDPEFIQQVIEKYGEFDLIVDDGSHQQKHVIKTFEILFASLKSGGLYVVEDSCCSYWPLYGGGYKHAGTSIEYFKNLVDDVNFRGLMSQPVRVARREDRLLKLSQKCPPSPPLRTDIESIQFINSMIFITKR